MDCGSFDTGSDSDGEPRKAAGNQGLGFGAKK